MAELLLQLEISDHHLKFTVQGGWYRKNLNKVRLIGNSNTNTLWAESGGLCDY